MNCKHNKNFTIITTELSKTTIEINNDKIIIDSDFIRGKKSIELQCFNCGFHKIYNRTKNGYPKYLIKLLTEAQIKAE